MTFYHPALAKNAFKSFETEIAGLKARNAKLVAILEWLDRKGGLGLDVHERIREALQQSTEKP